MSASGQEMILGDESEIRDETRNRLIPYFMALF
jgi:hypothetical protein